MKSLQQQFTVTFSFPIHFTQGVFRPENGVLRSVLSTTESNGTVARRKALFVVDSGVVKHFPQLGNDIAGYMKSLESDVELCPELVVVPGGEQCKNDPGLIELLLQAINTNGIDRHSFVVAVGGGAVLDLAGFAAAIAHRGIRHIRIPTTTLSQNDSGIGVKNGVNAFSKKNFLGTFTPPFAVINDSDFLVTLDDRDWRSGIAEAVKVALIKDPAFFDLIRTSAAALLRRDMPAMEKIIYRCAELHLEHIMSGDPFELGSSRPLDFGHWSAHKIEQLSAHAVRHGEAVAAGMALDATYSHLAGLLSTQEWTSTMDLLSDLGFAPYYPEMELHLHEPDHPNCFLRGLDEFREHLGGILTVMLLRGIGKGVETHEMDRDGIIQAIGILRERMQTRRAQPAAAHKVQQ